MKKWKKLKVGNKVRIVRFMHHPFFGRIEGEIVEFHPKVSREGYYVIVRITLNEDTTFFTPVGQDFACQYGEVEVIDSP